MSFDTQAVHRDEVTEEEPMACRRAHDPGCRSVERRFDEGDGVLRCRRFVEDAMVRRDTHHRGEHELLDPDHLMTVQSWLEPRAHGAGSFGCIGSERTQADVEIKEEHERRRGGCRLAVPCPAGRRLAAIRDGRR